MKLRYVLMALALLILQGCATQSCDKVQPYQQTVASKPLSVPADLSEPVARSRSPDIEPNAATRRDDGGCLELPPPFEPEGVEKNSS